MHPENTPGNIGTMIAEQPKSDMAGAIIVFGVFGVLGAVLLVPGGCGFYYLGVAMKDWLANGLTYKPDDIGLAQLLIWLASTSILFSITGLGLLLRLMRLTYAPALSLGLAVLATLIVINFHVMLSFANPQASVEIQPFLFIYSIPVLVIAALPPYLHWRSAKRNISDRKQQT